MVETGTIFAGPASTLHPVSNLMKLNGFVNTFHDLPEYVVIVAAINTMEDTKV